MLQKRKTQKFGPGTLYVMTPTGTLQPLGNFKSMNAISKKDWAEFELTPFTKPELDLSKFYTLKYIR